MPPKVAKGKAKQGVRTAKTGSKAKKPMTEKEQKEVKRMEEQRKKDKKNERTSQDRTFGLKNKNKSTVVKNYIKKVDQGLQGDRYRREEHEERTKEEKKTKAQHAADEMAALFGQIDMKARMNATVMYNGKKMTRNQIAAHKDAVAQAKADEAARLAAWDNLPLAEKIEAKRKELDLDRCTPVTEASFRAWREAKDAVRVVHVPSFRTFSNWPTSRTPLK